MRPSKNDRPGLVDPVDFTSPICRGNRARIATNRATKVRLTDGTRITSARGLGHRYPSCLTRRKTSPFPSNQSARAAAPSHKMEGEMSADPSSSPSSAKSSCGTTGRWLRRSLRMVNIFAEAVPNCPTIRCAASPNRSWSSAPPSHRTSAVVREAAASNSPSTNDWSQSRRGRMAAMTPGARLVPSGTDGRLSMDRKRLRWCSSSPAHSGQVRRCASSASASC